MPVPPANTGQGAFGIPNPFGRYRILRRLGKGGMGSVYLAEDTELRRLVALKIPHEFIAGDTVALTRFRREAQILAGINHPNICRIHDIGQYEGFPYLSMEYHEGRALDTVLVPGRPLRAEAAARIARKLALALGQAHERGIVHRDLKPSNVLMTTRKDLVILDFGLARVVGDVGARLSVAGYPLGTPAYMSPEQARGEPNTGPSCDIYCLGVILYEMLCGRRPFEGPAATLYARVINDAPTPPSIFHPAIESGLEAVCLKALEKDPGARHASMGEFAAALGTWLGSRDDARPPADTPNLALKTQDEPWLSARSAPSPRLGHSRMAIACGLAVLLSLVYLAREFLIDSDPKTPVPDPPRALPLAEGRRAGEERDDNALRMRFCWCPAGTFRMGSPLEERGREADEAQVDVSFARGFWLGKFEVTQAQWQAVRILGVAEQRDLGSTGIVTGEGPDHPMYFVNHTEALDFCRKLTETEGAAGRLPAGWAYRLPTEAEFEYSTRCGRAGRRAFLADSDPITAFGWFADNAEKSTHPVGGKAPSDWGMHDIFGNVSEWCLDDYAPELPGGIDPVRTAETTWVVVRGGGWTGEYSTVRSARRGRVVRSRRGYDVGFRVALVHL